MPTATKTTQTILNRLTGDVQFTTELNCPVGELPFVKLGMAVKLALKEKADLRCANLSGANLSGASLYETKNAELVIAQTRILPEGALIGWKKCRGAVIVKIRVPEDARRSHAFGRKCRAEFADVLEVIGAEVGISSHDGVTEYRVGSRIAPDSFSDEWARECAPGIHFFITRAEAEAY